MKSPIHILWRTSGQTLCCLRWLDEPGGDIGALERHLTDLSQLRDASSSEWKVHALILAERITGLRLTTEWLRRRHTRYFYDHI